MDQFNVLDITNDIDSLERDMNDWSLLTYDQRRRANDECMNRYGCTNQELYNMLKAKILDKEGGVEDDIITLENFLIKSRQALMEATLNIEFDKENYPKGYTKNGEINQNLEKIQKAKEILGQEDDDIVIINDFIDDNHMDYTLDELEDKYQLHVRNIYDHKIRSDYYSKLIWGRDVDSMYMYMKNKILSMTHPVEKDHLEIELSDEDKELNNYKLDLQKEEEEQNRVKLLRRKIANKLSRNELSLYEQVVLEGYFDKITVKGKTYRQGMPGVTPFLTYDEYVNNPYKLDQKKICNFDPFTYVLNFKDKEHKIKEEIMEAYRNNDTETLLSLGWNPVVEPTEENFVYARERQIKWMDEHCAMEIDDLSDFYTEMSNDEMQQHILEAEMKGLGLGPIYVIAAKGPISLNGRFDTVNNAPWMGLPKGGWRIARGDLNYNNQWCFPGIAFEPTLQNIYSLDPNTVAEGNGSRLYNMEKANLSVFSSDVYRKNADIGVFVIFVPLEIRKKIKKSIEEFYVTQGSSTRTFKNVEKMLNDTYKVSSHNVEFVLGTFLNSIFLIADIDLKYVTDRYSKVVSTDYSNARKAHAIMLYYGKPINYSPAKVESKTNALLAFNDYMDLTLFKSGLNLNKKGNNLRAKLLPCLEGVYIKSIGNEEEVNDLLKEAREICKAHNFMEWANTYYTEEDYVNKVNIINTKLSECGYSDIDKIQHLINELYDIETTLINNQEKLSSTKIIDTITSICEKYENLL